MTKTNRAAMNSLINSGAASDWKRFVAEYIVIMTTDAATRRLVSDYSVRRLGGNYVIRFGALAPYAPMTADAIYEWAQRLPLAWLAHRADDLRADILTHGCR